MACAIAFPNPFSLKALDILLSDGAMSRGLFASLCHSRPNKHPRSLFCDGLLFTLLLYSRVHALFEVGQKERNLSNRRAGSIPLREIERGSLVDLDILSYL